jgi:hypothetical protein
MSGFDGIGARLWQPLLSVIVAYAITVQSLLIAVAGFSLPAAAGQNAPVFELCLHDTSGAQELPAGNPDHSGCTHCIFCFAGAHHAVFGAAPTLSHRVSVAPVVVPWLANEANVRRIVRHTIANPRGPPVIA